MGSQIRWRQYGSVFLWRCINEKKQWHLSASDDGCKSLLELLLAMQTAEWPSKATISISKSYRTANGTGKEIRSADELQLSYLPSHTSREEWSLEGLDDFGLSLRFGLEMHPVLRQGICNIKQGLGDYSIGKAESKLWLWWTVPGQESI